MPIQPDISKYLDQMEEIKRRMDVVDFFISGGGHAFYQLTTVESVYLQFRKILELIAMASLVANHTAISKIYPDVGKFWNAELILRDIEKINANFYPKSIVEKPSMDPRVKSDLIERQSDYLTREEFVRLYKMCGAVMHAYNPSGRKSNYPALFSQMPKWKQRIVNLLNNHTIRLAGDENLYVIHMSEEPDGRVRGYTFAHRNFPD
jgi:hypothetical protein